MIFTWFTWHQICRDALKFWPPEIISRKWHFHFFGRKREKYSTSLFLFFTKSTNYFEKGADRPTELAFDGHFSNYCVRQWQAHLTQVWNHSNFQFTWGARRWNRALTLNHWCCWHFWIANISIFSWMLVMSYAHILVLIWPLLLTEQLKTRLMQDAVIAWLESMNVM